MGRNNPVRRAGRMARRLPGYRYARRTLLPRVRANATARSLVKRVFDVDAAQRVPLDVTGGTLLGGVGVERLPVVVVIMLGVPAGQVGSVVDEVAQLQVLTAGFRPVFVMDVPELGAARRFGYPAELLTAEADWSDVSTPWNLYASRRLASIVDAFSSSATVVVNPNGEIDPTNKLLLHNLRP